MSFSPSVNGVQPSNADIYALIDFSQTVDLPTYGYLQNTVKYRTESSSEQYLLLQNNSHKKKNVHVQGLVGFSQVGSIERFIMVRPFVAV